MNNYPRGKLRDDDEGELQIAIATQDNTIIVDFGKNVKWIGLDKFTALNMAKLLIQHAHSIKVPE